MTNDQWSDKETTVKQRIIFIIFVQPVLGCLSAWLYAAPYAQVPFARSPKLCSALDPVMSVVIRYPNIGHISISKYWTLSVVIKFPNIGHKCISWARWQWKWHLGDDHFSDTLEVVDIWGVDIGGWRQALLLLKRHQRYVEYGMTECTRTCRLT